MKRAQHQLEVPRALAGPGCALRLRADAVGRVAGARLDAPALVGRLRPAVHLERRRSGEGAMRPVRIVQSKYRSIASRSSARAKGTRILLSSSVFSDRMKRSVTAMLPCLPTAPNRGVIPRRRTSA